MNNKNFPLVSVMIPYCNCKLYITETIASVERQNYPNIEIIVVDDGSDTDDASYLAEFLRSKPDIRYTIQKNQGVAAARNHAARLATGEYFLFLDADDVILPDYVGECIRILEHNPDCKLVYSRGELFGAKNGEWHLPSYEGIKSLLSGNKFPIAAMHRAADFQALQGFDEAFPTHEDWDFWIRLLQHDIDNTQAHRINRVLFKYRKRHNGTSLIDQITADPAKIREDWQRIYIKHSNLFLKHRLGLYDLDHISKQYQKLTNRPFIKQILATKQYLRKIRGKH